MIKPNLFIPGAPKCGTSSLHEYLNLHPAIQMSRIKEPHNYAVSLFYKNRFNENFERSYRNIFQPNDEVEFYGESSTIHIIAENAPERIYLDSPDAKMIFILRDPIERILSHYNWLDSLGCIEKPFLQEVSEWMNIPFDADESFNGNYKHYVEFSKYGKHLERYIDVFGFRNIYIITSENLRQKPHQTVQSCFKFLNLSAIDIDGEIDRNRTASKDIIRRPRQLDRIIKRIPLGLKRKINSKTQIVKQINKKLFVSKAGCYNLLDTDIEYLKGILKTDFTKLKEISGCSFDQWRLINS